MQTEVVFLPGVQAFPSVCRLIPVGQAQLEALGAGARRQRWLQPPLFTAHGLRTTDGDTQTDSAHPPSYFLGQLRGKEWKGNRKIGANKTSTQNLQIQTVTTLQGTQESPTHQWDQWSFSLVWAPEALCPLSQWSGISLPVILPASAETKDLRRQKSERQKVTGGDFFPLSR